VDIKVFPIVVVAETQHFVWIKPDWPAGCEVCEYKPLLATFHSFYEAKDAMEQQLKRAVDRQRAACTMAEGALERALALVSPADG